MNLIDEIRGKLLNNDLLMQRLDEWKQDNLKVVFTNGCFDLLHPGHVDYLSRARKLGDRLVIGLNSDSSVSRLKGQNRPINNENDRAFMLAAYSFIDAIILFEEDTPYNLISVVKPHYLVKGGDYSPETVVGADIVENLGGKVIILPFIDGYSSSKLISIILKNN
jgi:D-glycero-beta-D-manno-heptose 1-phosphate adenylyltransferase